ncbi:MAG TPA: LysR family transcriptional regulator [Burkholderiales bacterium]|nr:LysR family transcriptional regulator [Burkholderiales bacterium]
MDPAPNLDRSTLLTLYYLLTEESVTRTALRLGHSQSAVSQVLRRLRRVTGDPLLVRHGRGMEITDHARGLLRHVQRALGDMERIAGPRSAFEPEQSSRAFRIATADYLDVFFHADLIARLRREAPQAQVEMFSLSQDFDYVRKLADGAVDVVIANWPEPPAHLHLGRLFESDIVCLMSRSHPGARSVLGWDDYLRLSHVAPTPKVLGEVNPVDYQLMKLGIRRKIRVWVPFFSLIPAIVARTDLVLTTSRQFVSSFEQALPLVIRPMPSKLPPVQFHLLWHERTHRSAECAWLREQIKSAADAIRLRRWAASNLITDISAGL